MKSFLIGSLFTLVVMGHAPLMAGVIHGTLKVPTFVAAQAAMNPYPGRANSMPGHHSKATGGVVDAVIHVDHVPAATESVLAAAARTRLQLAQSNQAFVPRVLAIAVGEAVDFPNQDPIYHNVFSLSAVRRFDLGKYPRGKSRRVQFPRPGLVNVYCDIHSDMEAFVLVLPHHGFARPSSSGVFQLPNLPAGQYTVRVWHPDFGERTAKVAVPETGMVAVDLDY